MGPLGTLFSAIDTTKRKLGDLFSSPVQSAQQMVGYANDRARGLNELTSGAAQEMKQGLLSGGNTYGPQSQQLAQTLADSYNPMGMTVWHGSPHKFTKFDASKIGSGEGAQAYGHGLYVAENPAVAGEYQQTVGNLGYAYRGEKIQDPITNEAAKLIHQNKGDIAAAKKAAERYAYDNLLIPKIEAMNPADVSVGNLYKIDLPDEHIAKMLDWDKPMSKQSSLVKKAWQDSKKMLPPNAMDDLGGDLSLMYGKDVRPQDFLNTWESLGQPAGAESALQQLGIPGIRYLDGSSRGTGQGTSNFVVFPGNEHLLQILERNGQLLK